MSEEVSNIIKKIQKNLICPICKRHFDTKEIKLKAIMDNILVFNITCHNNHPELQTLHIVMNPSDNQVRNEKFLQKNIYKQIETFDGDFIKLWKK